MQTANPAKISEYKTTVKAIEVSITGDQKWTLQFTLKTILEGLTYKEKSYDRKIPLDFPFSVRLICLVI